MKKILGLTIFLLLSVLAMAQTQQGIVKTRGKMVNGVLQKGTPLSGATVQIKDRSAMVSGNDGTFSFPLRTNSYLLQNVKKNGYQLVDMEACRDYKYSASPLYIVMEKPEQQQSDLLAAERKIRKNLRNQLDAKEAEIEALQASQQEKDSLLHILYQQQGDNEKLIADMAQRYATLDYDQLDEFYRQVSYFIENGELARADSLLRTRGDINTQVQSILQQGQAIQKQEAQLQQVKEVQQQDVEEAARRCYSYYEKYIALHQNDSAAHFLELRATLDTMNVEWENETGYFLREYLSDFEKALLYYQKALRRTNSAYGDQSRQSARENCYIGSTYYFSGNYPVAQEYIQKSIDIMESGSLLPGEDTAEAYHSLGLVYSAQGKYNEAISYYQKALEIRDSLYDKNHPQIAFSYNDIGVAYFYLNRVNDALLYHSQALAIRQAAFGEENRYVALSYNNLGSAYYLLGEFTKSAEYYEKALSIFIIVYGYYHPQVAICYNNIGVLYDNAGKYDQALEAYDKSLSIRRKIYGEKHPDIAFCYSNIANSYFHLKNYNASLEYQNKAIIIRKSLLGDNHPEIGICYNNIGKVYQALHDFEKALEYYNMSLSIMKNSFSDDHPNVTIVEKNIEKVNELLLNK